MYDAIIDILHGVWKNGFSLTALGTAVFVLLKQRKVKKRLRRYIPWLLDTDSEVKEYIHNQRLIMERLGIECTPADQTAATVQSYNKPSKLYWGKISMLNKLKSRKFWAAIAGAVIPVLNETLEWGLSTEVITAITASLVGYILGESFVDAKRAGGKNEESTTNTEHME